MKSDSKVVALASPSPAADAFRACFELLDAPAALCDLSLTVVTANAPFEVLCGTTQVVGRPLSDLFEQPSIETPSDGRTSDVDVVLRSGQVVTLTMTVRGQTVGCVARRMSPMLDSLAAAGRALIEQARIESQLLEIGRQVAGATGEEELVAAVAKGVKALFPGRTFCVRAVDPRSCSLTSLYAEGRMREGTREVFHLRRSMGDKTNLDLDRLPPERVVVTTGELPLLFQGSVRGIAAPLVASGQLFGAINIEYPGGLTADVLSDERILIQLANQVAVAVRNAKLIDELTFVRKYLEELIENANALILVVNRERKVVVFNRALSTLLGRPKARVLGHDLEVLVPEAERLKVRRAFATPFQTSGETLETALLDDRGGERRVALATSAVTSQIGDIEGVIAIGQDLTKTRELERRVVQAEKLASLGHLAASIVHEINNPMTAVSTYAEALLLRAKEQGSPPGDVSKLSKIVDNAERVLRFTRDLVSYAKPARERPEEIDLNQAIQRAVGLCEPALVRANITVETAFAELPRFLAVRQNLVQVFVNLITNACHATASGGRIALETIRDGDDVVVKVSDTGHGMTDEVKARIFEPFFTTKPDGHGTGLGLSIVGGIVEGHGGTVTVTSSPGAGTTFAVRLPMLRP